jgi:4-hydroxybenzoate polyprenyltransferase
MQERLRKLFEQIESKPITLGSWAITLFAIIAVRLGIENYFDSFPFHFADQFFSLFSHHFLTFTTIFIAALPIVAWAGQIEIRKAANVLIAGFLVIWTPPIVDEIISRGAGMWSFYSFDSLTGLLERYITFFGDKPDVGITYGVRFEVGIVVLMILFYTWIKSHSIIRTITAGLTLYTTLFIIGVLPSIVTILLLGPSMGFLAVTEHDIARVMLSPAPLFILNPPDLTSVLAIKMGLIYGATIIPIAATVAFMSFRNAFWTLFHNVRFPQLFYHGGLFLVGAALTFLYGDTSVRFDIFHVAGTLALLSAVSCAWLASVVVNDLRDVDIDRITNRHRPLVTGAIDVTTYRTIGILFFASSILLASLVSTQAALLLVLYQALAFLYSADPLRLKRLPIIATALAAVASLLIFFAGFIVFSTEKNISALPNAIPLLLFFAYLAIIPIKDFKDIAGDAADGVRTLPVILGEGRAKRFIGAAVFIVFVVSPFVLSIRSLFPLGLFFGTLGYWLLQLASIDHRYLSYRKLPSWFMLLAAGYGTFLALALGK